MSPEYFKKFNIYILVGLGLCLELFCLFGLKAWWLVLFLSLPGIFSYSILNLEFSFWFKVGKYFQELGEN